MIMRGKKVSKLLLIILTVALLLTNISTLMFASAANDATYTVDTNGKLTKISPNIDIFNLNSELTLNIPSTVKSIGTGVIQSRESKVVAITIPSSVTSIDDGAFSNCSNLKTVTVNNYEGAVSIADNAFPSSANITYTLEKPTAATTAAPVTTTKAPVTTTKAPVTTTKVPVTTTNLAEEEPTTIETEEATTNLEVVILGPTVEITDETPFASAKEQLSDMNVWDQLVNHSTTATNQPETNIDPVKATASYAAVVLVAFSAVSLGYFKFKK